MQLILAKDGKEELREGRNQTSDDGVHEEGVEGAPLVLRLGGAKTERSLPISLICDAAIWRVRARFFSVMFGGSRAGEYQTDGASAVVLRGAIARWRRKDEADLEISEAGGRRARKGI